MLSGEMLNELEGRLRQVRGGGAPWGGLQVVLSGDFGQLVRCSPPPLSPLSDVSCDVSPCALPHPVATAATQRRHSTPTPRLPPTTPLSATARALNTPPQPPIWRRPGADGGREPGAFLGRGYAFQAPAWARSRLRHFVLSRVHRQADPEFVAMLEDVRWCAAGGAGRDKGMPSWGVAVAEGGGGGLCT